MAASAADPAPSFKLKAGPCRWGGCLGKGLSPLAVIQTRQSAYGFQSYNRPQPGLRTYSTARLCQKTKVSAAGAAKSELAAYAPPNLARPTSRPLAPRAAFFLIEQLTADPRRGPHRLRPVDRPGHSHARHPSSRSLPAEQPGETPRGPLLTSRSPYWRRLSRTNLAIFTGHGCNGDA